MKKSLLPAIFCLTISSLSFGQLEIRQNGNKHILNDSTLYVYGTVNNNLTDTFFVANYAAANQNVYVKRDSLSWVANTTNSFCFGIQCYASSTSVATFPTAINADDTTTGQNNIFDADYSPNGNVGTTTIRYSFYNSISPYDTSWVIVVFNATLTGVQNIAGQKINISTPYPNPANSFATINYSLSNGVQSADLKIFNLIGECVQTLPLSSLQNKASINVQAMPSGIYVCEVQANGCQPVYQKLVVSH